MLGSKGSHLATSLPLAPYQEKSRILGLDPDDFTASGAATLREVPLAALWQGLRTALMGRARGECSPATEYVFNTSRGTCANLFMRAVVLERMLIRLPPAAQQCDAAAIHGCSTQRVQAEPVCWGWLEVHRYRTRGRGARAEARVDSRSPALAHTPGRLCKALSEVTRTWFMISSCVVRCNDTAKEQDLS